MISFEQVEEKIIKENWKITLGRGIAIDRQVVEFGLWSEQDFQQWVSRDKMPEPAKLLWSSMGEPQDQNLWTKRTKPEGIREWGQEAAVRECWRRRTTRRSLGSWLVWWKRQRGEMAWPARALALFFFLSSPTPIKLQESVLPSFFHPGLACVLCLPGTLPAAHSRALFCFTEPTSHLHHGGALSPLSGRWPSPRLRRSGELLAPSLTFSGRHFLSRIFSIPSRILSQLATVVLLARHPANPAHRAWGVLGFQPASDCVKFNHIVRNLVQFMEALGMWVRDTRREGTIWINKCEAAASW